MPASDRAPFPTEEDNFNADPRIAFSNASQTYILEDEKGEEWEWLASRSKWVPVTDDALMEQQQSAYRMAGVDEDAPALDPRKRKAADAGTASNGNKKQKSGDVKKELPKTAVYVTSLPLDVTAEEIEEKFEKYGMIAESLEGDKKRIKMYQDDNGKFKGEALIVYHRPESVNLAITMADETDFRLGQQLMTGPMHVTVADTSYKAQKDQPLAGEQAKKKGTNANRDRQKVIKKTQEMNNRLADWDDDDPQTLTEISSRWDKVVILKHMFRLEDIEANPAEVLEIKEDIRLEGEKFGAITNVVLYDMESDGVVTVRFSDAIAARACAHAFGQRSFDGQRVEAYIADGSERFLKSRKQAETEEEQQERLEKFSKDIERQERAKTGGANDGASSVAVVDRAASAT